MTVANRGMVLVLVGLLALQMSLTDAMLTFLRPGMRPWLVGAGATLMVLGGVSLLGRRDYVNAMSTHRAYLEAHPIRLIGFVTPQPQRGNRFLLTRFLVGCCAADAFPIQLEVHTPERPPAADAWVEVTARLAPEPRARRDQERRAPVLLAQSLHKVSKPSEPYEYPG